MHRRLSKGTEARASHLPGGARAESSQRDDAHTLRTFRKESHINLFTIKYVENTVTIFNEKRTTRTETSLNALFPRWYVARTREWIVAALETR